jgi:hypothetical protein
MRMKQDGSISHLVDRSPTTFGARALAAGEESIGVLSMLQRFKPTNSQAHLQI